jgi:hypothetical protein
MKFTLNGRCWLSKPQLCLSLAQLSPSLYLNIFILDWYESLHIFHDKRNMKIEFTFLYICNSSFRWKRNVAFVFVYLDVKFAGEKSLFHNTQCINWFTLNLITFHWWGHLNKRVWLASWKTARRQVLISCAVEYKHLAIFTTSVQFCLVWSKLALKILRINLDTPPLSAWFHDFSTFEQHTLNVVKNALYIFRHLWMNHR